MIEGLPTLSQMKKWQRNGLTVNQAIGNRPNGTETNGTTPRSSIERANVTLTRAIVAAQVYPGVEAVQYEILRRKTRISARMKGSNRKHSRRLW